MHCVAGIYLDLCHPAGVWGNIFGFKSNSESRILYIIRDIFVNTQYQSLFDKNTLFIFLPLDLTDN